MNITRFLLLFAVLLVFCLALMAAMMAQYGYSLFAPEMRSMLLVAFLVAGYVSFRISRIIARRKRRLEDHPQPGGAGKSKLSGLFGGKSAAQIALKYLVQQKIAAVTATTKPKHMMQALDLHGFDLTRREMRALRAAGT